MFSKTERSNRIATLRGVIAAGALVVLAMPGRAAGPPMRLSGMTFVASSASVTEVRVQAESGVIDDTANKALLDTVQAEWAGADGKPSLELTCEKGELDLETNDLVATGDVHGLLADGRRFVGPSLRYDRARGVAYTDAPVEIIEEGRVLSGGGFEYHVRDRRLRFRAGARVEESNTP
jgi:LPS export ABC transporter protein LptC